MRKTILTKVISLFLCLIFSQGAWAVVFNVTTAEEFQAALTTAASNGGNDQILLAPGIFIGNFYYFAQEDFDLKIASADPGQRSVIDANNENFGLYLKGGNRQFDVTLEQFVIRNANNIANGGGIHAVSIQGELTLVSMELLENKSEREGGAIYASDVSALKVVSSELNGNTAWTGAALFFQKGGPGKFTLESTIIKNNKSTYVDFIYVYARDVQITGLEFSNNRADILYSCMRLSAGTSGAIDQSVFTGNRCRGGLLELEGNWIIRDSSLADNSSTKNKVIGARWGSLKFERNVVDCNLDGIEYSGLSLELTGNLLQRCNLRQENGGRLSDANIVQNTWVDYSKPIELFGDASSQFVVENNIFQSPLVEQDLILGDLVEVSKLSNNLIGNYQGFWQVKENNLALDPMFYDAESGDFRLAKDSPLIDVGNNAAVMGEEATDLDGNPRIINGTVDIGAYERNTAPLHPADTNEDSIITLDEFNAYNTAWRANDTWPTPPNEIPIDYVTRAGYLLQKGGEYKNIGVGKPLTWVPVSE
jgi:hypothetical protein